MLQNGTSVVTNTDEGNARKAMVEFGDFYEQTMDRKMAVRLQVRVQLEEGAELKIKIQYDSDGNWQDVKTLQATRTKSFSFPVRVRRCDHYRIRLEGKGYWELRSMAREYITGSGVH